MMELDQAFHQREPQAQASSASVNQRGNLNEHLEHLVEHVFGNAPPVVANTHDGLSQAS